MENLLYILAALACPVGMGAMMWFMMRRPGQRNPDTANNDPQSKQNELTRLQTEIDQLRAEQRGPVTGNDTQTRP